MKNYTPKLTKNHQKTKSEKLKLFGKKAKKGKKGHFVDVL